MSGGTSGDCRRDAEDPFLCSIYSLILSDVDRVTILAIKIITASRVPGSCLRVIVLLIFMFPTKAGVRHEQAVFIREQKVCIHSQWKIDYNLLFSAQIQMTYWVVGWVSE